MTTKEKAELLLKQINKKASDSAGYCIAPQALPSFAAEIAQAYLELLAKTEEIKSGLVDYIDGFDPAYIENPGSHDDLHLAVQIMKAFKDEKFTY